MAGETDKKPPPLLRGPVSASPTVPLQGCGLGGGMSIFCGV